MQSNDICAYCKNQDTGYCMDCNVPVFDENEFAGIDAVPVVHGKWADESEVVAGHFHSVHRCSACDYTTETSHIYFYDYCPCCGARMDGEEE